MNIRPSISCLAPDQCVRIHECSVQILQETGIRVDSEDARKLFLKNDCTGLSGGRVAIPPETVQRALDIAPASIDIFNRNRKPAFTLGSEKQTFTRFGVGVTNLYYQEPETDAVRPFALSDTAAAARLTDALPQFDVLSTPGVAQDISPDAADLHTTLHMAANTVKPLVLLVSEFRLFEKTLDLMTHLFGELRTAPFAIPYVNPISPLVLNDETTEKMRISIEQGLPVIFNNYGMSGATTPITPGGTLALLNAELLAGLVYAQLVKPGAQIILGSLPAGFDMKTMMSLYTPHTMLLNLCCAEMMAYYRLPHSGTSGSGAGWGPDVLASGGFWLNHFTGLLGKAGLAPFVGGNFDSMAFSPAAVIYADEVIRMSRMFTSGFSLDDEAVGFEDIRSVGPGGNFLISGLTRKYFREMDYGSRIWPSLTLEQWLEKKSPAADAMLRKYAGNFLEQLPPPEDHEEVMDKGIEFIEKDIKK